MHIENIVFGSLHCRGNAPVCSFSVLNTHNLNISHTSYLALFCVAILIMTKMIISQSIEGIKETRLYETDWYSDKESCFFFSLNENALYLMVVLKSKPLCNML